MEQIVTWNSASQQYYIFFQFSCIYGWYKIFALNIKLKNIDAPICSKMDDAQKRTHLNARWLQ